jgi:hypothetical protein
MSQTPAPIPPKKPPVDWEAVEPHYRAGILSLKELGDQFGCSSVAILKHARKHKWPRDLEGKIKAKAQELVNAAAVNDPVNISRAINRKAREDEVVEANATLQYKIRIKHRTLIERAANTVQVLFGDLECLSSPEGIGLIEALSESLNAAPGETAEEKKNRRDKQAKAIARAFALAERADISKKLVDQIVTLINAERTAYGINDKHELAAEDPFQTFVRSIQRSSLPIVEVVEG